MTEPIYTTHGAGLIRITPDELRRLASQVEQAAADIQANNRSVSSVLQELQGAWQGQAAGQFQAAFQNWSGSTEKVVAALQRLAEQLRNAANRLEQADADGARLAAGGAGLAGIVDYYRGDSGGPLGARGGSSGGVSPDKVHDFGPQRAGGRGDSGGVTPDIQKEGPIRRLGGENHLPVQPPKDLPHTDPVRPEPTGKAPRPQSIVR